MYAAMYVRDDFAAVEFHLSRGLPAERSLSLHSVPFHQSRSKRPYERPSRAYVGPMKWVRDMIFSNPQRSMLLSDGLAPACEGSSVSVKIRVAPAAIASRMRCTIKARCPPRRLYFGSTPAMPSQALLPLRKSAAPPTTTSPSIAAYRCQRGRQNNGAKMPARNGAPCAHAIARSVSTRSERSTGTIRRSVAGDDGGTEPRTILAQDVR